MGLTAHRRAGVIVVIAATAAIAWFTLRPDNGEGGGLATVNDYLLTDLVLNVLLFIPLGVGLALSGLRGWVILTLGALSSTAIELAQLGWISGRDASFHDVVTNSLGTALGAVLAVAWSEPGRWRRVAGLPLAAALVAVWIIGAQLVIPSPPKGEVWFGQWGHDFAGTVSFRGRVLNLAIQGTAVPDGRLSATATLRERLARADTGQLVTDIVGGGTVDGRAQLVGVVSAGGEELASLWQTGTSLLARQRLRLSDLSIRTLWLRMDDALPEAPGDTLHLAFRATRRALELYVEHHGSTKVSRVRLSPEIFWTGFLPFEYEAASGVHWWPLTGVFLIFLVLGFLIAPHAGGAIAALALTLLIGPLIGRTALPSLDTVLAALGGILIGWWLVLYQHHSPTRFPATAPNSGPRTGG